jgi:hypothetical protein
MEQENFLVTRRSLQDGDVSPAWHLTAAADHAGVVDPDCERHTLDEPPDSVANMPGFFAANADQPYADYHDSRCPACVCVDAIDSFSSFDRPVDYNSVGKDYAE